MGGRAGADDDEDKEIELFPPGGNIVEEEKAPEELGEKGLAVMIFAGRFLGFAIAIPLEIFWTAAAAAAAAAARELGWIFPQEF